MLDDAVAAAPLPAGDTALVNPFPGLRSFESSETHLFFGRDGQSDELLKILAGNRFVAVVGTSGSGKSSLVRAGLLPALERGFMAGAGSNWRIITMRPGATPIENLAIALSASQGPDSGELDPATRQVLLDTTIRRNSFGLAEAARLVQSEPRENLLVLVDQFEEVFRLAVDFAKSRPEEDPAAFVRLLLEGVGQTEIPVYVAITMRSDFLGDCARFRDLPEMLNHSQYLIPRMNREQRRQAIEGPIAVSGANITLRLVQRLLNDLGDEPDQLPIMQHALMRTWDAWSSGGDLEVPIDLKHYESIGGMANALSRHADEAFDELDAPAKEIAKRLFQCLAEKGSDNRETRRPTLLPEICAVAQQPASAIIPVIDCFRSRGRTFLVPPLPEKLGSDSVIDISHESLIRLWGRLRSWTEEEAESAATYRRLADDAVRHKAGRAALWRDPGLALALEWKSSREPNQAWANRYAPDYEDAMAFLERSRRAGERSRWQRRSVVLISLVAAIGFAALWRVASISEHRAVVNEKRANQASALALARQLVAEAQEIEHDDPESSDLSALLAIESAKRATLPENQSFMLRAASLLETPVRRLRFSDPVHALSFSPDSTKLAVAAAENAAVVDAADGHRTALPANGSIVAIAFSPDGNLVATGGDDGVARVFSAFTGQRVSELSEEGPVIAVAFSPNAHLVATGSVDHSARVFDAASGKQISRLDHGNLVDAVAFGDGGLVATGSQDGTARVFEARTGKELSRLQHASAVQQVAFGPFGKVVATGSADGTARLFDARSGKELWKVAHGGTVWALAFSPDRHLLATGSDDGTARVIDVAKGQEISRETYADSVVAVAFSPDGRYVATGTKDKTARVFEASSGIEVWRFPHNDTVWTVAFAPDGRTLATGGDDKIVRIFPMNRPGLTRIPFHQDKVSGLAFSRDGKYVVSGTKGYDLAVFDTSGKEVLRLKESAPIRAVAFSSDEKNIAAAMKDGTTRIFDLSSGKEISRLAESSLVADLAFSPDGRYIATASRDQAARVFETQNGRKVSALHEGSIVDAVAFSPDSRHVATGSYDGTARVFDAQTGKEEFRVSFGDVVTSVAFSPDGRRLGIGSKDRTAMVVDAATGKQLEVFGQNAQVTSIAFSSNGRYFAVSSSDGNARLFDLEKEELVAQLPKGHPIARLIFIRGGSYVEVAANLDELEGTDLELASFPIDVSDLIAEVCSKLERNLTTIEWKKYLPHEPYQKTCPTIHTRSVRAD